MNDDYAECQTRSRSPDILFSGLNPVCNLTLNHDSFLTLIALALNTLNLIHNHNRSPNPPLLISVFTYDDGDDGDDDDDDGDDDNDACIYIAQDCTQMRYTERANKLVRETGILYLNSHPKTITATGGRCPR